MCSQSSHVLLAWPHPFHPAHFLLFLYQRQPSRSRGVVPRPLPYDEQQPFSSAGDSIPVGSIYEASHGSPGSAFLVRLPGRDLNQETLRVGLVRSDGHTEGANLSVIGSRTSHGLELPIRCTRGLLWAFIACSIILLSVVALSLLLLLLPFPLSLVS